MDSVVNNLAGPESLLGMLQRGRGKGYLAALEAAPETVWPLLFECITHDPRREPEWEDRAEYYAPLMAATHMDLGPLHHYIVQNDGSEDGPDPYLGLPLATLICLVDFISDDKRKETIHQIVSDYVSYGRAWKRDLQVVVDMGTPEGAEQAVAIACRRIKGDADIYAQFKEDVQADWRRYSRDDEEMRARCRLFLPICEPWKTICTQNRELADLFQGVGIPYDQPPAPREKLSEEYLAGLSLEDLFSLVGESNCGAFRRVLPEKVAVSDEDYLLRQLAMGDTYRVILALAGLGKLGTPRAFDAVKVCIQGIESADRKVRWQAEQAMEEMPGSLTLDTARQWFRCPEHHLQSAAASILEKHAIREDVPLLTEALRTPDALRGEDPRLSGVLAALARFDGFGRIPELEQLFCQIENSFWRGYIAKAMIVTAPVEFASKYAFECLWDCDDYTRDLGCEKVSLSIPGALERLRELAADVCEYDDTWKIARKRLEGF